MRIYILFIFANFLSFDISDLFYRDPRFVRQYNCLCDFVDPFHSSREPDVSAAFFSLSAAAASS